MHANRLPLLGIGTQPPRDCRKRLPGPGPAPARFELPHNFHHRAGAPVAPTGGFLGFGTGRKPTHRRQESTAALCASLAFGGVLVVAVVGGLIGVLASPSPPASSASASPTTPPAHLAPPTTLMLRRTPRDALAAVRFDVLTEENSLRIFSSRVVESERQGTPCVHHSR